MVGSSPFNASQWLSPDMTSKRSAPIQQRSKLREAQLSSRIYVIWSVSIERGELRASLGHLNSRRSEARRGPTNVEGTGQDRTRRQGGGMAWHGVVKLFSQLWPRSQPTPALSFPHHVIRHPVYIMSVASSKRSQCRHPILTEVVGAPLS